MAVSAKSFGFLTVLIIKNIICSCLHVTAPANSPIPASKAAAYIPSECYPNATRNESVQDSYPGGVEVKDPYRWLENPDCPETRQFVQDQMAITKPYLEKSPFRAELQTRYKELNNFPKSWCTFQKGKYFFSFRNNGSQNHDVLYKSDSMTGGGEVFLDVNTLSKDGSVSLSAITFTDDGKLFAYALSISGSDWMTVYFKDVEKGTDFKDKLEMVKYSGLPWTNDEKGIFYGGFRDQKGKTDGSENKVSKNHKIYYHVLGTEQNEDILIAEFPENPDFYLGAQVSNCGKYLIITSSTGCDNNLVYVADISNGIVAKPELKPIVTKLEANYYFIANNDNEFIFQTNKDADNYKLISFDITNPDPKTWKDLIPENKNNSLNWASAAHDKYLILSYIEDVKDVVYFHDIMTGEMLKRFKFDVGSVDVCCDRKTSNVFFNFASFLTPGITYHCDLSKPPFDLDIVYEIKLKNFDREKFAVEQVFFKSKDGTKVPMYIAYKKGLKKDGNNFAFLHGYGGFGCSTLPYFSIHRLVVMSNFDGIHATANIRGGGEYGEKWHQDGCLEKKQNSFDDFQAAAEFLIAEQYTNSKMLVINGGSNGGLLMGACLNQRPDLYAAVVADVGVMDLLRFDKFTIGHAWKTDYGSPSDPKFFPILYKYSPLHNIKIPENGDQQYPAVMLTTSDHDDRVSPLHSLKFIATLQYEAKKHPNQKNPFIIRVETDAGHGCGTPMDKKIVELVDMMCFIVINLGIKFEPFLC
ncbi:prolyl endopeptidase-like [Planococcus citri]|uniref:prolyl endopeptidase-like n=1 Tax=Planococcus citri TaxID=170843 RepID=UPI0031F939D5